MWILKNQNWILSQQKKSKESRRKLFSATLENSVVKHSGTLWLACVSCRPLCWQTMSSNTGYWRQLIGSQWMWMFDHFSSLLVSFKRLSISKHFLWALCQLNIWKISPANIPLTVLDSFGQMWPRKNCIGIFQRLEILCGYIITPSATLLETTYRQLITA